MHPCTHLCTYVCMYVCTYGRPGEETKSIGGCWYVIHTCIHTYTGRCAHTFSTTEAAFLLYIYIYIYIYIYVCMYIYIYIHVYILTVIHTYRYIHTYTHTYIHTYIHRTMRAHFFATKEAAYLCATWFSSWRHILKARSPCSLRLRCWQKKIEMHRYACMYMSGYVYMWVCRGVVGR
jgi:hypothetical protein